MVIKSLILGPLSTNCYIVGDEDSKKAFIIDPAFYSDKIMDCVKETGWTVEYVIFTHGHFDHMMAGAKVIAETGAKSVIHEIDAGMLTDYRKGGIGYIPKESFSPIFADIFIKDGDIITVGNMKLTIMHTPGHTPGSVCIRCGDCIFSGDTFFYDSIGRWDLPGGDYRILMKSINEKIKPINENLHVYPGHGAETTLLREKEENEFFLDGLK